MNEVIARAHTRSTRLNRISARSRRRWRSSGHWRTGSDSRRIDGLRTTAKLCSTGNTKQACAHASTCGDTPVASADRTAAAFAVGTPASRRCFSKSFNGTSTSYPESTRCTTTGFSCASSPSSRNWLRISFSSTTPSTAPCESVLRASQSVCRHPPCTRAYEPTLTPADNLRHVLDGNIDGVPLAQSRSTGAQQGGGDIASIRRESDTRK
jgi:hypothetical protein